MRLEYYWKLYQELYGKQCTYPEFIEAVMSTLEQELREKTSKIEAYLIIKPITIKHEEFRYDYS